MTNYTSSDTLISALKDFEGCRLKAYKPVRTEKYYTIGYGHYGADVRRGMIIREEEAEELLRKDLHEFEARINKLGCCRTQGQFDALVDFAFNVGYGSLLSSTLLSYIQNNRPTADIQAQFKIWNKSNKIVLLGLTKRREWEAQRWAQ